MGILIATAHRADYKFGYVFPVVGKDFGKMMIGLMVSVAMVLTIHYFLDPANYKDKVKQ